MHQPDIRHLYLAELVRRLRVKMVMEGIDQQLKRHAGVVDQRLRLVRRTQRALREAQRLHQAVDVIEGEQRRQVAQGACWPAPRCRR